jgi:hypothetical protein
VLLPTVAHSGLVRAELIDRFYVELGQASFARIVPADYRSHPLA